MNIICIIQARSTSTRLPNKVLLPLPYGSKKTVLENVIGRVKKSKLISDIVIATTINSADDKIVEVSKKLEVKFYRGSENNVLERYYKAAKSNDADIIVRITSDCPVIDYEIIDNLIKLHLEENNDYSSNVLKVTYPDGIDAEVFNFNVLEDAYINASEQHELEHVTPYIYKTKREKYKIGVLKAIKRLNRPEVRITLDTKEDYSLMASIYDYLYDRNPYFLLEDILDLLDSKPWLLNINKKIIQKKVCQNFEEEIEELINICETQDLFRTLKWLKER